MPNLAEREVAAAPSRPESDAGYLENATRIIFMGGLNYKVVDNKWPAFRRAFNDFDVPYVANMTPEDIEEMASDADLIRNRSKLEATVANAEEMQVIAAEHGSFDAYVASLIGADGVSTAAKKLSERFKYISEQGATFWLYATGWDIGEVSEKNATKYAPYAAV